MAFITTFTIRRQTKIAAVRLFIEAGILRRAISSFFFFRGSLSQLSVSLARVSLLEKTAFRSLSPISIYARVSKKEKNKKRNEKKKELPFSRYVKSIFFFFFFSPLE